MAGVEMGSQEPADGAGESSLIAALGGSGAAVAVLRGRGLVLDYANPAHRQLFGWPTGAPLRRAVPAGSPLLAAARQVLRTGEPARVDELPAGQGRTATVSCSPAPAGGGSRAGVLLVAVDTTEQDTARREAEDRSERLAVLDQATTAVTGDMDDPRGELMALARSVVPALADACAIYLIDQAPHGRGRPDQVRATRLTCVVDPAIGVAPPAPEIRLPVAATRPVSRAVVSGQPVLARDAARHTRAWGERWLHALAPHSLVAVPLGHPDVVAVVSFVGAAPTRPPYQASDVALMREISARADTAFGHAMQLQRANEVALALQRGLLPDPPELEWLEIAVRYRPAVPGLEVGGDWYDTLLLPGGSIGLAVGDVVGHDLYAVSTMIQLRSMMQALAFQPGAEPGSVLTALNRLCAHLSLGNLATLVYGRLDRARDPAKVTLTWANAGHPPPLLVPPNGAAASLLDHTTSPLLSLTDHTYRQATVPVPADSLLLFYTDGLIEDPERPSDDPIAELAGAVDGRPDLSLDELCDQLIAAAPNADDVALLAVRVHG
jgi:hypothetical protein